MTLSSLAYRREGVQRALIERSRQLKEIHMYYGGGILGTILVVALIVFLVRRSRI
jgi:hypothetical protein